MPQILGPLLGIAFWIVVIVLIVRHNKKKKEDKKMRELFTQRARALSKTKLPNLYFEEIFFQTVPPSNENLKTKIEGFDKHISHYFVDRLGPDILACLETISQKAEGNSIFFSSPEDMDALSLKYSPDEIDSKISKDIVELIMYTGKVRSNINTVYSMYELVMSICDNNKKTWMGILADTMPEDAEERKQYDNAINKTLEGFRCAVDIEWNNICREFPRYNNEKSHQVFINIAGDDSITWQAWKIFWQSKFMELMEKYRISELLNLVGDIFGFMQKSENKYWSSQLQVGYSQYSSICETSNFDQDEIFRIWELYIKHRIEGVYSKAKDPKYAEPDENQ